MMDLPHRKPNRLKNFDYSQNGAYFITICVKDRNELLWNVGVRIARPQDNIALSEYGIIIDAAIQKIPEHYPCVSVDKYVIMPNHIHIILMLSNHNGRAMRAPTIATIINQMKGYVSKLLGFSLWQKSYHDHIIRNEQEYQEIWRYIDENPLNWEEDCFYKNK
jgi:REP element-mobilizing transposase RayT